MERSKGLILIVVGLAAVLIIWKVGFKPAETPPQTANNAKQQTNTNAQNPQDTVNPTAVPGNVQAERPQQDLSRNQRGNRGGFNDYTGMGQSFENIGYKIALPEKLSDAELGALYNEYLQISTAMMGGRTRGGRGGMMGGDMGGMGGGMMGGGRGGRGDMMGGDMSGMGGF